MYKSVWILVAVLVALIIYTEALNNAYCPGGCINGQCTAHKTCTCDHGFTGQYCTISTLDRAFSPNQLNSGFGNVPSTDSIGTSFPTMERIESVLRSGFENASLSHSFIPGFSFDDSGDGSYSVHGLHNANPQSWNLQCVWNAMESAAKFFPHLHSLHRTPNPAVEAEINRACRQHASTSCHVNYDDIHCDSNQVYRLLNGTCNNLQHSRWGSSAEPFDRFLPPHYADGVSSFRTAKNGDELPNPRRISVAMKNSKQEKASGVTLLLVQWGQFLDHDVTHTQEREIRWNTNTNYVNVTRINECCEWGHKSNSRFAGKHCMFIDVEDDPEYRAANKECIRFLRSMPATLGCAFSPLQQVNQNTAFVDASMVYGSRTLQAENVRSYSRGLLRTSPHPINNQPMPPRQGETFAQQCPVQDSQNECFLAGDPRIDEVQGLTALHTTFVRLHNILAVELCQINPHWCNDDEKLFQETRRIVIALIQQITYRDWLPHVVGPAWMDQLNLGTGSEGYRDAYNQNVNPTIRNVFAAAAFRFGHTLISDVIPGHLPEYDIPQEHNFFNISTMVNSIHGAPSALLKGMARCPSMPVDAFVERTFTDRMFAASFNQDTGLDLVAINIQRGRDHGIPPYREWRKFCGLSDVNNLQQLHSVLRDDLADSFSSIYNNIDDIDLFPAGLSEPPVRGGIVGPTFACIIARQFEVTKHGDRFWYENSYQPKPFSLEQLSSIRSQGLSSILCAVSRHTAFGFQPDPFLVTDAGNPERNCASYNFINLQPWRET